MSCGTPAMGGEDRQKAWKKADSFQEQKELFGVSSCFPTLSLVRSTAPPPASLALPPQPQNGEMGSPGLGTATQAQRVEEEKDGPADIPLGHQLMADTDSCVPMSSPTGWGRCTERGSCSPRGRVAMSPRLSSDQDKGQPVLHQEQCVCMISPLKAQLFPPWVQLSFSSLALSQSTGTDTSPLPLKFYYGHQHRGRTNQSQAF